MKILIKAWRLFEKKQRGQIIGLVFLIVIGTVLETVGVTAIVPFISAIIYPDKMMENAVIKRVLQLFNINDSTYVIVMLAIALILVYVIKNAYLCFMYGRQFSVIYNSQKKLAKQLVRSYMDMPYSFHLQHNTAEMIHNVTLDVDTFYRTVLSCITLLADVMVCISLLLVLFVADKSITLATAFVFVLFILTFYKRYKNAVLGYGVTKRTNETKHTQYMQQAFGGIKEVKILNCEQYFDDIADNAYSSYMDARRRADTYTMMPKPLFEAVCVTSLLAVVIFKVCRGIDATYFVPTLSIFALAVIRLLPSGSRISSGINAIIYGLPSIDALYNDISLSRNYAIATTDAEIDISFNNAIEMEKVSFAYDDNTSNVLNCMSLKIYKNCSTAFVGPSGSGKTTLADLLLGVHAPTEGDIKVDGVSILDNIKRWQGKIGYIPQNIYLIDDTIRRNIAFAIKDEEIDDYKVWDAIDQAQLREFVNQLPDGLDSTIGELGVRISGGQRQRIGIARALYRNPEILVLDEATSALDSDTEKAVMESIDALNGKKTMIIIAHRLTTIKNCDYIYEIKDGKAVLREYSELTEEQ